MKGCLTTRRILTIVLLLVTLGTVGTASAETPEELTKQCQSGDAKGCFSPGRSYQHGDGVKQDFFKAVEFYRKACDGQDAQVFAVVHRRFRLASR